MYRGAVCTDTRKELSSRAVPCQEWEVDYVARTGKMTLSTKAYLSNLKIKTKTGYKRAHTYIETHTHTYIHI